MHRYVGTRLNHDVYGGSGHVLIKADTLLTSEHIQMLERREITLTDEDVTYVGPYAPQHEFQHAELIEQAVTFMKEWWEEFRRSSIMCLHDLRSKLIPIIEQVSDEEHLLGLFASLQSKDDYTYRHNIAVGIYSHLLGNWLELERKELLQLTTAALLHDIGKIKIPLDILNKPSKLTYEEYKMMKSHTQIGYRILTNTVGLTQRQALVALQHHERMDGSGYPLGLQQSQIDLFSRIVSVADVFHAMASQRVYRDPSPFYKVLSQMEEDMYGLLDPVITKVFIEKIMDHLMDTQVLLTDGSIGVIQFINRQSPTRPLVQVESQFIDLSRHLNIHIERIL